ncbi:hypothetical protein [Chondrinema litorale]|uniref:hypothetical protein n=1 Tax=Chondrinema litorale TaxID=2994555 RepID=UPI002542B63F|nr:hypothetical protein [Chondrinema litorale]UZR95248.1 hypothetical protein OQ292_05370 [Chondrinema litorale]
MDNFMIAFVAMLATVFFSRLINEKANKKLDPDKKLLLIDLFSDSRSWSKVQFSQL